MEGQEDGETFDCSLKDCRTYKDTQLLQLVKKTKASLGKTIGHMVEKCVYIKKMFIWHNYLSVKRIVINVANKIRIDG